MALDLLHLLIGRAFPYTCADVIEFDNSHASWGVRHGLQRVWIGIWTVTQLRRAAFDRWTSDLVGWPGSTKKRWSRLLPGRDGENCTRGRRGDSQERARPESVPIRAGDLDRIDADLSVGYYASHVKRGIIKYGSDRKGYWRYGRVNDWIDADGSDDIDPARTMPPNRQMDFRRNGKV